MPSGHRLSFLLLAAALAVPGAASAQGPCHDLQALTATGNDLLAQFRFTGDSCIRVDQHGAPVYAAAFGSFSLQTVVPIASATKTLSAAVLLALVDQGLLRLDDPVGRYLPEWNTGLRASITLRMCFTHTAGLPANHPLIADDTIALRTAAAGLAQVPLQYVPGTAFEYGGVSMHVAGAVCEVVSGRSWAQLFQQAIAGPLQMTATDYQAFGPTANPRIAGGARSDQRDYAAFLDMLRQGGVHQGVRVLSAASVAAMLTDQTSGLPVRATPHPENAPYGIGIWLDRRDAQGRTVLASGAGAFGFVGWLDLLRDATGVFVVQNRFAQVWPFVQRCQQACDDALLPSGVACLGRATPACAPAAWLNATRPPRAGDAEFALAASRAPALSVGAMLLGGPLATPLVVFDLEAHLALPPAATATVLTDADGRATLPAPVPALPAGTVFAAQAVFLDVAGCGSALLRASHALSLSIAP